MGVEDAVVGILGGGSELLSITDASSGLLVRYVVRSPSLKTL